METIILTDRQRLALVAAVIQQLEASGDPRAAEAITAYQRQRAELEARIAAAQTEQAPAQVIGMQTALLAGN